MLRFRNRQNGFEFSSAGVSNREHPPETLVFNIVAAGGKTFHPFISHALGAAFLVLLALGHDGGSQPAAEIFGQFIELGVAIDLDGLLGCIADYIAVVAPGKMVFQLDFGFFVENAVQIIGQLLQKVRAFHWSPSPLETSLFLTSPVLSSGLLASPFLPLPFSLLWKYRPNRSRSCRRARSNRDFTAGMLNSSAAAVSSVERPSTSRKTNTVRNPGGRPWMVLLKISRNSDCVYCCSGFGLQSAISRGRESSSVLMSSSNETVRSGLRRRSFISASLTAIRTSQV